MAIRRVQLGSGKNCVDSSLKRGASSPQVVIIVLLSAIFLALFVLVIIVLMPGKLPAEKEAVTSPAQTLPASSPTDITNSIGMKLKLIPAGEFTMGSNASPRNLKAAGFVLPDGYDNSDEQPAHSVRITKPFYMGVHEVTRGQFAAFVSATGYQTDAEKDGQGGWGIDAAGTPGNKPCRYPHFAWICWG